MKKIFLIVMILATAAFWLSWSTNESSTKSQIAEGSSPSASFTPRITTEVSKLEEKTEEQIRFSDALEELDEVTEEYNRKAVAGELTSEDERNYAKALKVAAVAFAQYQKNTIQQLKSLGDI